MQNVAHKLTEFMDNYLPMMDKLGVELGEYDGDSLRLKAPLAPSINDKLTAFGGSLFCLCVMNCWGMVYLKCQERGFEPSIVVGKAEIEFLRPVAEDFEAVCISPGQAFWDQFFEEVASRGRARARLESLVQVDGKDAVRFSGQYTLIGKK